MSKPTSVDRVNKAVQIGGVRLVDASAKTQIRSVEEAGDANLHLTYGATVGARPDSSGVFYVLARMDAKVAPDERPKAEPLVTVSVTFELRYRLPEGFEASSKELQAFAEVNGVFNAWPYFRELIQTATGRMEIPPIVLPLYRHVKPPPARKRVGAKRRKLTGANPKRAVS